jgi:hypothetical protein
LVAAGFVALLVSAWGGIVPFVGPTFGFSADGASSWHWNLAHAALGLAPGAVGFLFGLSLLVPSVSTVGRRRIGLSLAGLLAVASGAWFAIGPLAWPVLSSANTYFVSASSMRMLEYSIGYSLGPGLILAMAGAFAWGWGARHDQPLGVTAGSPVAAPVTESSMAAPMSGSADPGPMPPVPSGTI